MLRAPVGADDALDGERLEPPRQVDARDERHRLAVLERPATRAAHADAREAALRPLVDGDDRDHAVGQRDHARIVVIGERRVRLAEGVTDRTRPRAPHRLLRDVDLDHAILCVEESPMKMLGLIAGVLAFGAAASAQAKVLDLYAQAQGGGGYGQGIAGAQKDHDFFNGAAGGLYGARVGAEFMWVDGWVEHVQFTDGSGVNGTWTQFMAGMDWDFALGDPPAPGKKPKTYGEIGFGLGFGMGTGQQVDPPLDNSEITDKGFVAQLSFGADYRLNSVMSIGLTVPITYAYLWKQGFANDEANQYQSVSANAMIHVRFHLELR